MSQIKQFPFVSHLRAEPTVHVLRYRNGRLVSSRTGGSFWFRVLNTAVAEVPVEDREQSFLFTGRTADFQDVAVQGTITFRVVDAELAARRVDFGVDLEIGLHREAPLDRLAQMVSQTAQQLALDWIARRTLEEVLRDAVQELRPIIADGLRDDAALAETGLEVATVRVSRVAPNPDLEKALQAPTRERMQQVADEAVFKRRALAVEKERAIAENELANEIELATREEQLIAQRGANEQRRVEDEALAKRIGASSKAEIATIGAEAKADAIRMVQAAETEAEEARVDIYRDLAPQVIMGLAAQELAGKLERIDHLNLGSDGLGALLENLATASIRRIES